MILILDKTIRYRTLKHEFENKLVYIETFKNDSFDDCYIAHKSGLFPDGTLKPGAIKYFYCPFISKDLILESENKKNRIDPDTFTSFDRVFSVISGEIVEYEHKNNENEINP